MAVCTKPRPRLSALKISMILQQSFLATSLCYMVCSADGECITIKFMSVEWSLQNARCGQTREKKKREAKPKVERCV